jgi:hypothetical protein
MMHDVRISIEMFDIEITSMDEEPDPKVWAWCVCGQWTMGGRGLDHVAVMDEFYGGHLKGVYGHTNGRAEVPGLQASLEIDAAVMRRGWEE